MSNESTSDVCRGGRHRGPLQAVQESTPKKGIRTFLCQSCQQVIERPVAEESEIPNQKPLLME